MRDVVIVDSGVANLTSVLAAMERLGASVEVSADAVTIRSAPRVILPGVGAAQAAMAALESKGLVSVLKGLTQPVLGICLGMQLLFERSTEGEGAQTLGVIKGEVQELPPADGKPIPHMGWNQIMLCQSQHPLLRGVLTESFYYFVHSFAAAVSAATLAKAEYTAPFTAIAGQGNFMGCQFHPERSGEAGALILRNFMDL